MTVNGKKDCAKYAEKKNYCPLKEIKESKNSGITFFHEQATPTGTR